MAQYIKMSNGGVSCLVSVKDRNQMAERLKDGFEAVLDKEGNVVVVDSASLVRNDERAEVNELLEMLKDKKKGNAATKNLEAGDGTDNTDKNEDADKKEPAASVLGTGTTGAINNGVGVNK